jgi:hypothetical protein
MSFWISSSLFKKTNLLLFFRIFIVTECIFISGCCQDIESENKFDIEYIIVYCFS